MKDYDIATYPSFGLMVIQCKTDRAAAFMQDYCRKNPNGDIEDEWETTSRFTCYNYDDDVCVYDAIQKAAASGLSIEPSTLDCYGEVDSSAPAA
jgi:hypothetical protein